MTAFQEIQPKQSVLFIDSGVADYQTLIDGAKPGTEVHVLDAARDGLAQIAQILNDRSGIDAIHIISHGEAGKLLIGSVPLTLANLGNYTAELTVIGDALTPDGDILLYGCHVGSGKQGIAFVTALANATGANVAASDNPTGAAALGGDWQLEIRVGQVKAVVMAPSPEASYQGLLAVSFSTASNPLSGIPDFQTGTIVGDFDTDGDIDVLAWSNQGSGTEALNYYRNNGSGAFTSIGYASSPFSGVAAASQFYNATRTYIADFDTDGDLDVWDYAGAANNDGASVYMQNNGGAYALVTGGSNPLNSVTDASDGVIVGDFDTDGDTDVLAYNTSGGSADYTSLNYYRNDGGGTFTSVAYGSSPFSGITAANQFYTASRTFVADFDNDGDMDIWDYAGSTYNDGTSIYMRNDSGTDTYTLLTGGSNPLNGVTDPDVGVIVGDFDTDDDIDVLAYTDNTYTALNYYQNNGSGTFTSIGYASSPFSGILAANQFYTANHTYVKDFDQDGDVDIWDYRGATASDNASLYFQQTGAPPVISSSTPADNGTGFTPNANITLTFNETISSAGTGTIEIYLTSNDTLVESIPGNDARVTGTSSSTITIDPNTTLADSTGYYILIDKRAFFDADGMTFQGIGTKTVLNFTTGILNTAPTFTGGANTGLTVLEDAAITTITTAMLEVKDAEQATSARTYTVGTAPAKGTLTNNGTTVSTSGTFTQANIDAGLIKYTPNSNANGSDSFTFSVSDGQGGTLAGQTFNFTITAVNDAPTITSNGSGTTASISVNENATAVTTVTSSDVESDTVTYSISGGADSSKFSIDGSTGVLTFSSAPNFESATDSDTNNTYVVAVTATDNGSGTLTDVQTITVTVQDVNEAPTAVNDTGSATEASGTANGTTGSNATGNVLTDGTDDSDPENNSLSVTAIRTGNTEGAGTAGTIGSSLTGTYGSLTLNSDGTYTYAVDDSNSTVQALKSGQALTDNFNYTLSDGTNTDIAVLAITVNGANDAPTITSNGGGTTASISVNENATAVTTVTGSDVESDTVTYSISGGADSSKFSIDGSTGVLTFSSAPNFESATDSDTNNTYVVAVTATDNGTGTLTDVQTITVTVQDANDAPVITSNGGGATASISLVENTTAVTTVTASDADSNTVTYSLSGGSDQAKFAINAATGALTFVAAPSFTTPTDADTNNIYDVQVTATDDGTGNLTDLQTIAVTITATPPSSGGSTTTSSTTTIDGVDTETTIKPDGTVVMAVEPVEPTREEDSNSLYDDYADIPIATDEDGNDLLTVSLSVGIGMTVKGLPQELNPDEAKDSLVKSIKEMDIKNGEENHSIAGVKKFVKSLQVDEQITVQTVTLTTNSDQPPQLPILVTGTANDNVKQALVIDVSKLPSGTIIQLDNVDFAVIIGAAKLKGGSGNNYVIGDDQKQFIVLGEGDDILSGGGGNDTVGSLGGDDKTSGDAGDDIVYGGIGNDQLDGGDGSDHLNGGFGFDRAIQSGALADYAISVQSNSIMLTGTDGKTDTFTDVESIQFATGPSLLIAYSTVEAVAHHLATTWFGRELTATEGDAVQNWTDATTDNILAAFYSLSEASGLQDKTPDELLAGLENNPNIIRLDTSRKMIGGDGDDQGYLPLGLALEADGNAGVDVLRMTGGRDDIHLEFNGDNLEITRLEDGAMLSIRNAEAIAFDSGETTIIAHNSTEAVMARLAHGFFNRGATSEEWQMGLDALNASINLDIIVDWLQQNTDLGGLSDTDYIQTLFAQMLGRSASDTELNFYLDQLEGNQVGRNELALDFAESSETVAHLSNSILVREDWV